jgi:hypothetical protein
MRKMETIGEHFAELKSGTLREAIALMTYGQYPDMAERKHADYYRNWEELIDSFEQVVRPLRDRPFLGPPTCALLMDFAMHDLKAKHCLRVPGPWLPVIKKLRLLPQVQHESKPKPESTAAEFLGIPPAPSSQPTQGAKYSHREEVDQSVREAFGLPPDWKSPK